MRVAVYVRVSTQRQQLAQTIEQQLERLCAHIEACGWSLSEEHVFRDDGYSGAQLNRPGLDALRDRAALAEFERVVITAPDRLARRYAHQVLILEELGQYGCQVDFLDRPMSEDPHDQLLLQIRGAVAEYERTLIAERMRRGRLMKLHSGRLLPWVRRPYGYILDPDHPRDPTLVRLNETEAALVGEIFAWYTNPEERLTLYGVAKRLSESSISTPSGLKRWNVATIRGILTNPAYTGIAYANINQTVRAQGRRSALIPVGSGESQRRTPREGWIAIPVPAVVSHDLFDSAQERLRQNRQGAPRNNTAQQYLLRGLVSCGRCRLSASGRLIHLGYAYYVCRGRTDALRVERGERCTARYAPAAALDRLVWEDLCQVLTRPEIIARLWNGLAVGNGYRRSCRPASAP